MRGSSRWNRKKKNTLKHKMAQKGKVGVIKKKA